MNARPIIQLLSWVAGLFAGLSMLASCGFAQCREPEPMVTGTFSTLTLTTIANGGGAPPPDLAGPFEAVEPLSLEVQDDKAVLSYRVPTGNGVVSLEWINID